MLKIASYSLRGQVVRVKLKCTCGNGRVFEVDEEGKRFYFCGKCRSRKTLEELKKEASTYWRGHEWVIECEPDQRTQPRIHAHFGIHLTIKAARHAPTYCTLNGSCVVLSESGMLALVDNFQEHYFQDITSTYRYVEITSGGPPGLPPLLTGRVVGVRFRPDELPRCRIGVGFEDLGAPVAENLRKYIEERMQERQSTPDPDAPRPE